MVIRSAEKRVVGVPVSGQLLNVYRELLSAYGPQGWWPASSSLEIIVGAILAQGVAWLNVERSLANLRRGQALSVQDLTRLPEAEIARMVRPALYYNSKARRLKGFATFLQEKFRGDVTRLLALPLGELRAVLLGIHGIGQETADTIALYAASQPIFVVDGYTRRIFRRLGFSPESDSYSGWQTLFMENLPPDVSTFNEYHALVVQLGKMACRPLPKCTHCPLLALCPTGDAACKRL